MTNGDDAHRPWHAPASPWVMRQKWHDLLFMHWPVAVQDLRPLIPRELELETFDGTAWVGVVPFHMSGIRLRGLPPIPGLSAFPELNVRTYVRSGTKPGECQLRKSATRFDTRAIARIALRQKRSSARHIARREKYSARSEARSNISSPSVTVFMQPQATEFSAERSIIRRGHCSQPKWKLKPTRWLHRTVSGFLAQNLFYTSRDIKASKYGAWCLLKIAV